MQPSGASVRGTAASDRLAGSQRIRQHSRGCAGMTAGRKAGLQHSTRGSSLMSLIRVHHSSPGQRVIAAVAVAVSAQGLTKSLGAAASHLPLAAAWCPLAAMVLGRLWLGRPCGSMLCSLCWQTYGRGGGSRAAGQFRRMTCWPEGEHADACGRFSAALLSSKQTRLMSSSTCCVLACNRQLPAGLRNSYACPQLPLLMWVLFASDAAGGTCMFISRSWMHCSPRLLLLQTTALRALQKARQRVLQQVQQLLMAAQPRALLPCSLSCSGWSSSCVLRTSCSAGP